MRIIPEDPDFHGKFYSGNTASKNLARTEKRGIRRNNQRFKQRRDKLYQTLKENDMFPGVELLKLGTKELYQLRAKSVTEKISLQEFGRVLMLLNQRRGFLSNRKSNSEEENTTDFKKKIEDLEKGLEGKTIGQQLYEELEGSNSIQNILLRERTYLRNSYLNEFDRIWDQQSSHHPNVLTGNLHLDDIKGTLYDTIRNRIIYYQRPLKSQKGLVSPCLFEKHQKGITKSSPYFELFRIWQKVNDLSWKTPTGETNYPTLNQKKTLVKELFFGKKLNKSYKLTVTKIKEVLGYKTREKIYLNFTELDGSRTYSLLEQALINAEIKNPEKYLFFNPLVRDEKGGLLELWHITYSLPTEKEVVNTLKNRFNFSTKESTIIAQSVGYPSDYGSLSTRAIKKLLPHLHEGLQYSEACDKVGYDHSGYKTKIELKEKLPQIRQNSLRNPVVEQVLNQTVNMVNLAIEEHGPFDEIRVELARELRNSAKTRKSISAKNASNKKENEKVRKILREEYNFKIVNGRDVKRYKLWEETSHQCLYCNNPIQKTDLLNGQADIEHILPKSRSFNNALSNYILAHRTCNADKGQKTAFDFMETKGKEALEQYIEKVNALYKDGAGKINKTKFENLLCKGVDIPSDFVERMKKDSQYIAKEAVKMLKKVCDKTHTTTGQVTDLLREEWGLKEVLQEVNFHKYEKIDQLENKTIKDHEGNPRTIKIIKDWSKRDDHRHHAIDALISALTDQKIIFKLNNLNKIYQYQKETLSKEEIKDMENFLGKNLTLKEFADQTAQIFNCPIKNIREETRKHLDQILISFKKNNGKVLTPNTHKKSGIKYWTPRGRLHEETVMGKVKRIAEKKVKLNRNFNNPAPIVNPEIKILVHQHLLKYNNNPKLAFSSKTLKLDPILHEKKEVIEVKIFEEANTKRVVLDENITPAQVKKIADKKIKTLVENRILEKGNIKEAFINLDKNPLWINQEKEIKIKRVTVYDESKVIAAGLKKDYLGKPILIDNHPIPAHFVKTGGNHHALIYLNEEGNYMEKVVSFWDAVGIGLVNLDQTNKPYPIISRNDDPNLGKFLFSMQINDLFVFDLKHSNHPKSENEINFLDPKNRGLLSSKLFRVQKLSKNNAGQFHIYFRHHLETQAIRKDKNGKSIDEKELKGIGWEAITKNSDLNRLSKIRINHLGKIIKIGE